MPRLKQSTFAAASGVLLALAFPKVVWSLLAWVAFMPLLWVIQDRSPKRAFGYGWIAGMEFYLCTLYWVVYTIGLYSNLPPPVNDAWFGRTSAPYQHLVMEAMRTVETRVPMVRAANTGLSAVIDLDGRVRAQTALYKTTVLVKEIAWPQVTSFYTAY